MGSRPLGWTSGDAAGLAMFPALVRYDECERGIVNTPAGSSSPGRAGESVPATRYASSTPRPRSTCPQQSDNASILGSRFHHPFQFGCGRRALLLGLKEYQARWWPTTATSFQSQSRPTIAGHPMLSAIFHQSGSPTSKSSNQQAPMKDLVRPALRWQTREPTEPCRSFNPCN